MILILLKSKYSKIDEILTSIHYSDLDFSMLSYLRLTYTIDNILCN